MALRKWLRRSKMDIEDLIHCLLCAHRTDGKSRATFPQCGHMFCTPCLLKHCYMRGCCTSVKDVLPITDLQYHIQECPICQLPQEVGQLMTSEVPANHKLFHLCQYVKVSIEKGSKTKKKLQCEISKGCGRDVLFVCITCNKHLCGQCWQQHESSMPDEQGEHIILKMSFYDTELRYQCTKHKNMITHLCTECKIFVCDRCTVDTTPRLHPDHSKRSLSQIQESQQDDLQRRQEQIRALCRAKEDQKRQCDQIRGQMAKNYEGTKKDIQRVRDRLVGNIEQTSSNLLQELEEMYKQTSTLYNNHVLYLDYTRQVLGSFQFFIHGLTQRGQEPIATLHEEDVKTHLEGYTSKHTQTMEEEALTNLRKVPAFISNVQYDEMRGITLGHITLERRDVLPSDHKPIRMPEAIVFIPGGDKKWEADSCISGESIPKGILYTETHNLLVAEYKGQQISCYDASGQKQDQTIKTRQFSPQDIALNKNKGLLYVTDDFKKIIRAFNQDGQLETSWKCNEKFSAPCAIATNGTYIVVSDTLRHSVTVLQTDGRHVRSFGREGSGIGEFKIPEFLILDDQDEIVVSDRDNHRVCVFDLSGQHKRSFGCHGDGPGELKDPSGICQDEFGYYLVVDSGNSRVCRFSREGVYERTVIEFPIGSIKPYGIAISMHGDVAMTDRASDKIVVYKLYNL